MAAESSLKRTTRGYTPTGVHWRRGMPLLWEVRQDMSGTEDGRLLAEAHGLLKKTEKGYDPRAPRWREAMERIDWVEAGLMPPAMPYLGPIIPGGKAISLEAPTHNTDGLYNSPNVPGGHNGSHYPAFDFGWSAGKTVIAWEPLTVTGQSSAMGADALYATGESGLRYWLGHITRAPVTGTKIRRGVKISTIAAIPGADHGHLGIDARPLIEKDFKWGRHGNGPDYSFGAKTIGQQLAAVLIL